MSTAEVDDNLKKQLVVSKLTTFFRAYDGRQVPQAEKHFLQNQGRLSQWLADLVRRYPRAPADYFSDLLASIEGIQAIEAVDEDQRADRYGAAASLEAATPRTRIAALLRDGESLLEASYPGALDFRGRTGSAASHGYDESGDNDDTRSRRSGFSGGSSAFTGSLLRGADESSTDLDLEAVSQAHHDDLLTLKSLIAENRELARDVALAEQQVLQKRLDVLYQKLVVLPSSSSTSSSLSVSGAEGDADQDQQLVLHIQDSNRQFQLACSRAQQRYLTDGVLTAPISLEERDHCLVSFRRALRRGTRSDPRGDDLRDSEEPRRVMMVVLSMALRVWARYSPHGVSEISRDGEVATHPSSVIWWQWPTVCQVHRGLVPEALVAPHYREDSVGLPQATEAPSKQRLHTAVEAVLTGLPDHSTEPSATFWTQFVQQYEELSRSTRR